MGVLNLVARRSDPKGRRALFRKGENMGTQPDTETHEQAVARRTEEAKAKMTDRHLEDRVRAFHPHAAQSDEAHKAMLDDYDRLAAEAKEGSANKPMGTAG
jgi:hypothetical protein